MLVWLSWEGIFDQARRQQEISELEEKAASPDLWNDPAVAQALHQRLSQIKETLAPWRAAVARLEDLEAMCELLEEEGVDDIDTLHREHILPGTRISVESPGQDQRLVRCRSVEGNPVGGVPDSDGQLTKGISVYVGSS